ncbi:MAG: DNA internalization-related competence protein ComEC/Rec2, partial [Myxococcota bacterium]
MVPASGWYRAPLQVAVASLAATLTTLPIVATHFQRVSWVGMVANVPAAPVSSFVLVPLALAGGLIGQVSSSFANVVLTMAGWAADVLVAMARLAAAVPFGASEMPAFGVFSAGCYYFALIAFFIPGGRGTAAVGVALCCGAVGIPRTWLISGLTVTFLPVGQGDAALVEFPDGRTLLVDTGPPGTYRSAVQQVILPFLRRRGIHRLDALVLSHPHADHVGGIDELRQAISIERVWWSGDRREVPRVLLAPIEALEPMLVRAPMRWIWAGVTVELLAPDRPVEAYASVNDASVVMRLRYGQRSILLTGDAEASSELRLVQQYGARLVADVLKLGHHGSRTSTTEAFLRAVQPRHAVVCAGLENKFGFPHREVMTRLRRRNVRVWRTDIHGAVTVHTDGR